MKLFYLFTVVFFGLNPFAVVRSQIKDLCKEWAGETSTIELRCGGIPAIGMPVEFTTRVVTTYVYDDCRQTEEIRTTGYYVAWALEKPSGSTAELSKYSNSAILIPDIPGDYYITATYLYTTYKGESLVTEDTKEISFAGDASPYDCRIPPHFSPRMPNYAESGPTYFYNPSNREKCDDGIDELYAQWVTVYPWHSNSDYTLLEGQVMQSKISDEDNPYNHSSLDMVLYVRPDLPYRYLISIPPQYPNQLGVEWESRSWPERYRPSIGDRISVWGYWIHDCGHSPYYTEMHPPVGVAVHRERPIQISADSTFNFSSTINAQVGRNVWVPGILTDVWFNSDAGQTMSGDWMSLGQPRTASGAFIPGPSNIKRDFSFKILLPTYPKDIAHAIGESGKPEVPLYVKITDLGDGDSGPDPTYRIVDSLESKFLEVTLPLHAFEGNKYSRRIETAWVYPSPDNWGLSKWRLRVTEMDVHKDGDNGPWPFGDGDWVMWLNIGNADKEWIKAFDCEDCVNGTMKSSPQLGPMPWVTNDNLGDDLRLFPGQTSFIRALGYEEDNTMFTHNSLGKAGTIIYPGNFSGQFTNNVESPSFTVSYEVSEIEEQPCSLSREARTLYDSYCIPKNPKQKPDLGPSKYSPYGKFINTTKSFNVTRNHDSSKVLKKNLMSLPKTKKEFFQLTENRLIDSINMRTWEKQRPKLFMLHLEKLEKTYSDVLKKNPANRKEVEKELEYYRSVIPKNRWRQVFRNFTIRKLRN